MKQNDSKNFISSNQAGYLIHLDLNTLYALGWNRKWVKLPHIKFSWIWSNACIWNGTILISDKIKWLIVRLLWDNINPKFIIWWYWFSKLLWNGTFSTAHWWILTLFKWHGMVVNSPIKIWEKEYTMEELSILDWDGILALRNSH